MNVEKLFEWAKQGRRNVEVSCCNQHGDGKVRIWVYDYDLMTGESINSVDEIDAIDLKAKKLKDLKDNNAEIERLLSGGRENEV